MAVEQARCRLPSQKFSVLAVVIPLGLVAPASFADDCRRVGSTIAGAILGAATGSLIGGGKGKKAATIGGTLLGGTLGSRQAQEAEAKCRADREAERDRDMQRQLEYEQQSAMQQAQVQRQIEEQRRYEEWRRNQAGAQAVPAAGSPDHDQVVTAQRLLRGLGLYNGPIDGIVGSGTEAAIFRFEAAHGLTASGKVTDQLIAELRAAI